MNTEVKPTRGRPKKVDRESVIKIVMEAYWQEGMFAFSLNELCQKAQVSKPALYREFGGEDGLMAAVLDYYRENNVLPLLSGLNSGKPFAEVMVGAIDHLTSDRGTPLGCLLTRMRLATKRLGPMTSEKVQQVATEQRDAYLKWFQAALENGEANTDVTPEFAAQFLDTQFASLLVQMSEGVDPEFVNAQAKLAMSPLLVKT